jgi:mono/diheme cytochrome c family protein
MKYNSLSLLVIILLSLSIGGCYYDVEEELYGGCDTTAVSYSKNVAPMLLSNGCLGCHTAPATNGGNLPLDSYSSILEVVQSGKFVSGADRMPPSSAPDGILSDCDINKLRSWVNTGAPNN